MFCGAPLQGLAKLRLHVLFRAAFTGSRDSALSRRQLLVALEWSPMHVFLKVTDGSFTMENNFICHKRESSGFFSQKNPPKPKKGPNLFFEVQIVGFT
jgi:hypothetical protein